MRPLCGSRRGGGSVGGEGGTMGGDGGRDDGGKRQWGWGG